MVQVTGCRLQVTCCKGHPEFRNCPLARFRSSKELVRPFWVIIDMKVLPKKPQQFKNHFPKLVVSHEPCNV